MATLTNKNLSQFLKEKNALDLNMEMEAKAVTREMQSRKEKEPSTDTLKVMLRLNGTIVRGKRAIGNNGTIAVPSPKHNVYADDVINKQSPLIGENTFFVSF